MIAVKSIGQEGIPAGLFHRTTDFACNIWGRPPVHKAQKGRLPRDNLAQPSSFLMPVFCTQMESVYLKVASLEPPLRSRDLSYSLASTWIYPSELNFHENDSSWEVS